MSCNYIYCLFSNYLILHLISLNLIFILYFQIVGKAPSTASTTLLNKQKDDLQKAPIQKKKGQLFNWLDEAEKDKKDYEEKKYEKMNEIHQKRMMIKMEKEAQQKRLQHQS